MTCRIKPVLVLASKSPRRREILSAAGLQFQVRSADVPEVLQDGEQALEYVQRLAQAKARAISMAPGDIVLGADTIVVLDGEILEKPLDAADARRMLLLLSGRDHQVITGICLLAGDQELLSSATTLVRFSSLTGEEIQEYVATGEPMDKAGAYAIQGRASRFVERVEGCYFNVVGLPISLVYRQLQRLKQQSNFL